MSNYTEKIKRMYDLLNQSDLENEQKEKFYPNVIITGQSSSGKSSLLETILMMDLFPKSFHEKKVKINIKKLFFPLKL